MTLRTAAVRVFEITVIGLVVVLVVGQGLGQPILLSYVESGSMAPTMHEGDGFIAIPSAIAGPVERGDVIIFKAERLRGGGLTTHRIIGSTERGYITKGDANSFPDQDSGEPPVQPAQIVAVALTIDGSVVVIPHLGTVIEGGQKFMANLPRQLFGGFGLPRETSGLLPAMLAGLGIVLYLLIVLQEAQSNSRSKERSRERGGFNRRWLLVFAIGVIVLSATASMVVPGGVQKFGIVSAENDAPGPRVIQQGETETFQYRIANHGLVPIVVFLEPKNDAITIDSQEVHVSGRSDEDVTISLSAPPEIGYYRYFLAEHRYLGVLPIDILRALYRVHPWAPILIIDGMLATLIGGVGVTVIGTNRVWLRSRTRTSIVNRLKNRLF